MVNAHSTHIFEYISPAEMLRLCDICLSQTTQSPPGRVVYLYMFMMSNYFHSQLLASSCLKDKRLYFISNVTSILLNLVISRPTKNLLRQPSTSIILYLHTRINEDTYGMTYAINLNVSNDAT